jgi:FKBP-type peptidyl-prolyl cis-trans isomerase
MNRFLCAAAMLLLTGCGNSIVGPQHVTCPDFLLQYGSVAGDTIETPEGLRYLDIQPGSGVSAAAGAIVDVNYSGYLLNGTPFDSSCPASRTVLRVTVAGPEVIRGFALGLVGMRPGGVRRIVIPPELGYGSEPVGSIPANSTLVFDLQLVGFSGR